MNEDCPLVRVCMNLRQNLELLFELTKKEIKIRYKNAFLGILWSLANPLAFALVYYFVFKLIMRSRIENFSLFLITGLFPWQWFANSLILSTSIFISNKSLIKKTMLPKTVLLLASIMNGGVHFLLSVPVVVLFLLLAGKSPSLIWLVGLPAMLIPQFLIILGLSWLFSSINVFFRDLQHLVGVLIQIAFWLTPIVYPHTGIPKSFKIFVFLNPMTPVIISYRQLFLEGRFDIRYWCISLITGLLLSAAGYSVYRKLNWKFAELL
ncbi:MAG: ABC transporter permease [Sedimentisphaerales bacterium]|nr:ABC transporter permease [Sedimentisphaerales bacterium]